MKKTEMRNEKSRHIDTMDTVSMLKLISEENFNAAKAVDDAIGMISAAVDAVAAAIAKGARMIYIGAGTSGRLGVLDAAECPPTFGVGFGEAVDAILAGGIGCMIRASEGAEDSGEAGVRDLLEKNITPDDVIVGISASGGARYVNDALLEAKKLGCLTVGISSVEDSELCRIADFPIFTDTGAEVITGSTRMKAGTAQKLVLNMLSTCAMIKNGKVYENLMSNLRPTNQKLRLRVIGIVKEITGLSDEDAIALLEENEWNIRKAVENRT